MQRIDDKRADTRLPGRLLLGAGILLVIAACRAAEPPAAAGEAGTDLPAAAAAPGCGTQGFLSADLLGAISADLAWQTGSLECAGMQRPEGRGARLRFAGPLPDSEGRRLAIIIAIPELTRGATGRDLPSNVTVSEEGTGRFFSTADLNNCWSDIDTLEANADSASRYAIGGALYCVGPLPEINGSASVTIAELEFLGQLDWDAT